MTTVTIRARLILIAWWTMLLPQGTSSFDLSLPRTMNDRRLTTFTRHHGTHHTSSLNLSASSSSNNVFWTPQDLTKDNPGFVPLPPSDYIKKYQASPELWPVEFFVIAYRYINIPQKKTTSSTQLPQQQDGGRKTTQILVRKSANGTSKYGVGTGVPATRWMLSSQSPPMGYKLTEPRITFDACHFPEFPASNKREAEKSWKYTKIDICEDALESAAGEFYDAELREYACNIHERLKVELSERLQKKDELSSWDYIVLSTVKSVVDKYNSISAIQGAFRMSGLFSRKEGGGRGGEGKEDAPSINRFVEFNNAPDPSVLAKSTRIYTMFPQMPDPMMSPSSTPDELQHEIISRPTRMKESGRDPHKDKYGRVYTHISTSNVSNTIHGVYITFDATDLPGLDDVPPAYDLFGTKSIQREWVSLSDLKVVEEDGEGQQLNIGVGDTKSTFISGFILRQLVREGIIEV